MNLDIEDGFVNSDVDTLNYIEYVTEDEQATIYERARVNDDSQPSTSNQQESGRDISLAGVSRFKHGSAM